MGCAGAASAHLAPPALPAPVREGGRVCSPGLPFTAAPRVFPFPLPHECSHLLRAWRCIHLCSQEQRHHQKLSLLVPLAHPTPQEVAITSSARQVLTHPPVSPQLVTAAAAPRSVSMTGSCSGASGTEDTASTAATTRPGPTARAAGRTSTAGSRREPASPATATPQVRAALPSRAPASKFCPSWRGFPHLDRPVSLPGRG